MANADDELSHLGRRRRTARRLEVIEPNGPQADFAMAALVTAARRRRM
jgi:hypothetical protein